MVRDWRPWYSADRLKPFYGRRSVRKLCDHIDLLKRMHDQQRARADEIETAMQEIMEAWDAVDLRTREGLGDFIGVVARNRAVLAYCSIPR